MTAAGLQDARRPSAPSASGRFVLRPHLHHAVSNDRAVFLDLVADQYFCLPDKLERTFLAAIGDAAERPEPEELSLLIATGILVPATESAFPLLPDPPKPLTDLVDAARRPAGMAVRMAVTATILKVIWQERHWSLLRRLEHLRQSRSRPGPPRPGSAERAVAFETARRSLPARRNCLRDSLALAHDLARRRHAFELVVGVTMEPFAAHCWVQHGSLVLNDDVEHVRPFVPILAL